MASPSSSQAVSKVDLVKAQGIAKTFDGRLALAPMDLDIKSGEFLVTLGPSGCGKSTLMRILAGLEKPDLGTVTLAGEDVTTWLPHQRDVAMVFQLFTLYPHLHVLSNVTFPLRAQGVSESEANRLAMAWLDRFEIGHLAKSRPRELSGGDRQKIAMARALVRRPKLFLFDEPLSALDPATRETVWEWIRRDLKARQATCLLVTHDQIEAMTLGDRIAVMREGRLEQCDLPQSLYDKPANLFVADFVGTPGMNLLPAMRQGEWVTLQGLGMRLRVTEGLTALRGRHAQAAGEIPCTVGIRPEWVLVGDSGASLVVEHTAALGAANLLEMRFGDKPLRSWLPAGVKLMRGEAVRVQVMPSACRFFDGATSELLPWRAVEVKCPPGT